MLADCDPQFNTKEFLLLSGLGKRRHHNLCKSKLLNFQQNSARHYFFGWEELICCTVFNLILEFYPRSIALTIYCRLRAVLLLPGYRVDVHDYFSFESWNEFNIAYRRYRSLIEWEAHRSIIQFSPRSDCEVFSSSVVVDPIGDQKTINYLYESWLTIYIQGIIERFQFISSKNAIAERKIEHFIERYY